MAVSTISSPLASLKASFTNSLDQNGTSFVKNTSQSASLSQSSATISAQLDGYEGKSDRSHEKLLSAAKTYLETASLVSQLLGKKQSSQRNFYNPFQSDHQSNISRFGSQVLGSNASDLISIKFRGQIDAGKGNDVISALNGGTVKGGDGNDIITTHKDTDVFGGEGNDFITSYGAYSNINAGEGNNVISSYGFSNLTSGSGSDFITAYGNGQINSGDGNDIIRAYGAFSTIDAGAGKDTITAAANSQITGGAGDDIINANGKNITLNYNPGDGSDRINSSNDLTINFGRGISSSDISIETNAGETKISFKGSSETLRLNLSLGASAKLSFSDGSSRLV